MKRAASPLFPSEPLSRWLSMAFVSISFLAAAAPAQAATGSPNATTAPAVPAMPLAVRPPAAVLRPDDSPDVPATATLLAADPAALPTLASTTGGTAPATAAPSLPPPLPPLPPGVAASVQAPDSTPAPPVSTAPPASAPPVSADPYANDPWKRAFVSLVDRLVQRGGLTRADSDDIIQQAQEDANPSHTQATEALASSANPAPTPASPASAAIPPLTDDTVHVNYVPETVKDEMREEIKQDVIAHDRDELWSNNTGPGPETFPRFRVFGDIRVRAQDDTFPSGNDDSPGAFPNFNAINTGSMFDLNAISNPAFRLPQLDTNQDRFLPRLRARFGTDINLGDGFTAGLRAGTGADNSPVTENQTLGAANNGQGGDFAKYAIWLDRGFIKYEMVGKPNEDLTFEVGRMDNPFFGTSMIWADDIGFDGLAVTGKYPITDNLTLFGAGGAFSVFNTDLNFSSAESAKFKSEDKWLFAGQAGLIWKINEDFTVKGAAALYDFENIAGKVSDPYVQTDSTDEGNTADSRPSFAQNGNTYIALNNVEPNPGIAPGQPTPLYEYFGLATGFQELALTGQVDISHFDPFHIWVVGEFVDNLAFDRSSIVNNGPPGILSGPQNNIADPNDPNSFYGGNKGYNIRLSMGRPALEKLGDWNVNLTYRYIESDAVVDGFVDSDFGGPLAGTNLQGYMVGLNVGLSPHVWTTLRWMSADAIAGPTYKSDVIQFDINAQF